MKSTTGIMILTGTWAAFSSARWRRLIRISADCTRSTWPIGMPNASAWTMALDEGSDVGQLGAVAEGAQGVGPAAADLHLLQHALELAGERSLGVLGHLLQGRVEAETGLDRDGQQVDGVRQRLLHVALALAWRCCRARCSGAWKPMASDTTIATARSPGSENPSESAEVDGRPPKPTMAPRTLPERTRSTVQPAGLPARSSRCRIRSSWSARVTRRPRFWKRCSSGSRTRSPKGWLQLGGELRGRAAQATRASPASGPRRDCGRSSTPKAANDDEQGAEDHQRCQGRGSSSFTPPP